MASPSNRRSMAAKSVISFVGGELARWQQWEKVSKRVFIIAILVNLADQMGRAGLASLAIPYARTLWDDKFYVALSSATVGFNLILSSLWMTRLADRTSARFVIMLSLTGSAVAYSLEAISYAFVGGSSTLGFWLFFLGRSLEGFFGCTAPVLKALLSQWFNDEEELTKRLLALEAAGAFAGMWLAPVGGLLATIWFPLPLAVVSALCLLCLLVALCKLPAGGLADAIKAEEAVRASRVAASVHGEQLEEKRQSLWVDVTLQVAWGGHFLLGIILMSTGFLLPLLLNDPIFGIIEKGSLDDPSKFASNQVAIAQAMSSMMLVKGVVAAFFTMIVFPKISKVLAEPAIILICGGFFGCIVFMYAFLGSTWQVYLVSMCEGAGIGIVGPAVCPILTMYGHAIYPTRLSECIGMPVIGMSIGLMVGANFGDAMRTLLHTEALAGERAALIAIAVVAWVMTGMLSSFALRVSYALEKFKSEMSEQGRANFDQVRRAAIRASQSPGGGFVNARTYAAIGDRTSVCFSETRSSLGSGLPQEVEQECFASENGSQPREDLENCIKPRPKLALGAASCEAGQHECKEAKSLQQDEARTVTLVV